MKIPVSSDAKLDEKIVLRRKIRGLLPVERCFVNGQGKYCYNISGRQSLDTLCKVKNIEVDLIEKIINSICGQIEILEWNLLDVNGLILDPELIFVSNVSGEITFTFYPRENGNLNMEFQQMMEYLITKVDHKDADAVNKAYSMYERTLNESYSIRDVRDCMKRRSSQEKEVALSAEQAKPKSYEKENDWQEPEKRENRKTLILDLISKVKARILDLKEAFNSEPGNRKKKKSPHEDILWVSPEVEDFNEEPEVSYVSNPTICLRNYVQSPQGLLLYDGGEDFENIHIKENQVSLGKGMDVDVVINKGTISNLHAKIERDNSTYYIEDLNSTNGTLINGEALNYKERRKLEINDIVQFADLKYRFV